MPHTQPLLKEDRVCVIMQTFHKICYDKFSVYKKQTVYSIPFNSKCVILHFDTKMFFFTANEYQFY